MEIKNGIKGKIPVYQLPDKLEGLLIVEYDDALLVASSMQAHPSLPHRHDHYCCYIVDSGTVEMQVDFQKVIVGCSSLLISFPGQVHQLVTARKATGRILAFDVSWANENFRALVEEGLDAIMLIHMSKAEQQWVRNFTSLLQSTQGPEGPLTQRTKTSQSLLHSFIHYTTALYQQQESRRVQENTSRSIDIAKRFRQLVRAHYKTIKKPSEYAARMNLSLPYLNDTVKSTTGFPLTYYIQQEVVTEAQRLLYYSDMSIKEIAEQIGYDDYKYFMRLFGKTTGQTPTSFRKKVKA